MKLVTAKDLYLLCVITVIQVAYRSRSVRLRHFLANAVASLAYRLSKNKRRLIEKNVSKAFEGKLSKERSRTIVKSAFYQFWLETLSMPYSSFSEARVTIDVCGLENLQKTLKRGNGAILWESSYFGRRNLAKHILHRNGFAIDQVHAHSHLGGFGPIRANQSWTTEHIIRPFFDRCERSFLREIIYLTEPDSLVALRIMLDRLKNNRILCLSADGTRGHKFIPVSLLGRTISFPTGTVSLARITNTPILPLFCFADTTGRTNLTILPPLQIPSGLQREQALEQVLLQFVTVLESHVRKYPEQYRKWDYSCAPSRTTP